MIARLLNYRPVTVFALLATLHTFAYGLGYLLGSGGFPGTILYGEIETLLPHAVFGGILVVVALFHWWGLLREHVPTVKYTAWVQGFIWFFVFLVYTLADAWLLGVGVGLVFALAFAYLAYIYKDLDTIAAHRLKEKLDDY